MMHDYLYYFDMIEYAVYHTERELMNYEALCKELQHEKNHQKRCAVEGGHDYLRRCFKDKNCYTDLSETIEENTEEKK